MKNLSKMVLILLLILQLEQTFSVQEIVKQYEMISTEHIEEVIQSSRKRQELLRYIESF